MSKFVHLEDALLRRVPCPVTQIGTPCRQISVPSTHTTHSDDHVNGYANAITAQLTTIQFVKRTQNDVQDNVMRDAK